MKKIILFFEAWLEKKFIVLFLIDKSKTKKEKGKKVVFLKKVAAPLSLPLFFYKPYHYNNNNNNKHIFLRFIHFFK